jgi:hypothetical protein
LAPGRQKVRDFGQGGFIRISHSESDSSDYPLAAISFFVVRFLLSGSDPEL